MKICHIMVNVMKKIKEGNGTRAGEAVLMMWSSLK